MSAKKRTRDEERAVFDIEVERGLLRAKRTRLARKNIVKKMKRVTVIHDDVFDTLNCFLNDTRNTSIDINNTAETAQFNRVYRVCNDKLLALEEEISAIRQLLPDTVMAQQRAIAEQQFSISDIRNSDGAKGDQSLIIIDPPWESDNPTYMIGTKTQYSTMSDAALCALPIAGLASEDCALLMWTTFPKLESAFRVLAAWGFKYQTVFLVWIKIEKYLSRLRMTHGSVTRPNAEIILIGTRGNMRTPLRKDFRHCNVLLSRPQEHSAKPEVVKQIAIELYGDKPRMEIFSRTRTLDWRCWGNEAGQFTTSNLSVADPQVIGEVKVVSEPETERHAATKKERRNNLRNGAFANAKQKRLEASRRGNGGKMKASINTFGYYTAHNCITKQQYIFHSDGAGTQSREIARECYLQRLREENNNDNDDEYHPTSDLRIVDFVTASDLATNRRIDEFYPDNSQTTATNEDDDNNNNHAGHHSVYSSLTNKEVADNIEMIHREQKRNSDMLFAFNYNKKKKQIIYPKLNQT